MKRQNFLFEMKNIIIIGVLNHQDTILDSIKNQGDYNFIGYVDSFIKKGRNHNGYPILGNEHDLPYLMDRYNIYGGIVAAMDNMERRSLVDRVLRVVPDFNFIAFYHPSITNVEMGRLLESNGRTIVENDFANKVKTQDKEVFIHPLADVHTKNIGNKTKVWQFSVILEKARIGGNCNINSHTFIENNVVIGDNVTIKCGVYLWDGVRIKDDVFIGPNVTFTNDKYPKSKNYPDEYQEVIIEEGASIGANSTVLGGVRIGQGSMIGAGSVVSKNVPEGELWVGNPARFVRKMEQAKVLPVIEDKLKEVEV